SRSGGGRRGGDGNGQASRDVLSVGARRLSRRSVDLRSRKVTGRPLFVVTGRHTRSRSVELREDRGDRPTPPAADRGTAAADRRRFSATGDTESRAVGWHTGPGQRS